jgi:hypothetical protein
MRLDPFIRGKSTSSQTEHRACQGVEAHFKDSIHKGIGLGIPIRVAANVAHKRTFFELESYSFAIFKPCEAVFSFGCC